MFTTIEQRALETEIFVRFGIGPISYIMLQKKSQNYMANRKRLRRECLRNTHVFAAREYRELAASVCLLRQAARAFPSFVLLCTGYPTLAHTPLQSESRAQWSSRLQLSSDEFSGGKRFLSTSKRRRKRRFRVRRHWHVRKLMPRSQKCANITV